MKILGQITTSSERFVTAGRDKVQSARRRRQRHRLLTELGEICFDQRTSEPDPARSAEADRLVDEISALDAPGEDTGPRASDDRKLETV